MADIVERLRQWSEFGYGVEATATMKEAAAEIERLRAALNRLADEPFSDLISMRAFVCSVLRRGGNG